MIGNNCLAFFFGLLDSYFSKYFRKWLTGALLLVSCFQKNPDTVILQKYQSLLNQSFKHILVHVVYLNWISKISFQPRFCMLIINSYYKKQTLVVLGILVQNISFLINVAIHMMMVLRFLFQHFSQLIVIYRALNLINLHLLYCIE